MPRPKLSLPHERRKAQLKAKQLNTRVKIAELKETLQNTTNELKAMRPPPRSGE